MTQEEMGNAILNIQETLKDMKAEDRKRDGMLLNVQNTLIKMQQDNKERFEKIDERFVQIDERFDNIDNVLKEINKRTSDIENDVSFNLTFMEEYFSRVLGSKNVDKFDSKSHMQILEEHEDRISKLESEKVANQ